MSLTPEQRRYQNRVRHLQARQNANVSRGPKGLASIWWDQARSVAARADRDGDPEAWEDLARALENWCHQAEQRNQQQHAR